MPSLVAAARSLRAAEWYCGRVKAIAAMAGLFVGSFAGPAGAQPWPEARRLPADGGHPAYVHTYVDLNNDRAMDLGLVGPKYRGPGALERCVLVFRNEHARTPLALLSGPEDESFGTNARLVADHDGDGIGDLAIESRFLDADGNVRLREHVFGSVSFLPIASATEPRESARVLAPAGDVNYDGVVDAADITRWIDSYLRAPTLSTHPGDPLVQAAQAQRRAELLALATNPDAPNTGPSAILHPRRMDVDGDGLVTLGDLEALIAGLGAQRDEELAPVGAIVDDEGDGPVAPLIYLPPRNNGGTGNDAGDGEGTGGGGGGTGGGGGGGSGGGSGGGPTDPTPCDHDRLRDLFVTTCRSPRAHADTLWLPMPAGGASAWACLTASAGAEWTWEVVSGDGRIDSDPAGRAITLEALGPGAITVRVTARDAGCSASATFTVRAYRVDVDIDAFNVAPFAAPTGDSAEEQAEDELGRFVGEPGKVIVAGLGDTDGDGIADQIDGFNRDAESPEGTAEDDQCDQRFVPMRIRIEGLSGAELSRARLTLRWPDSDPLRIETTCEAFQLVPEGVVRVWTVDGSAPRSGRAADCGGEWLDSRPEPYEFGVVFGERADITVFVEGVVPGPWGSLSGGPIELGVDVAPFTHEETVLGQTVARFGGAASDSVKARVVAMQLEYAPSAADWFKRAGFVSIVTPNLMGLDETPASEWGRYQIRIADDRDLEYESVWVGDATLPLSVPVGWEGYWATPEFVPVRGNVPVPAGLTPVQVTGEFRFWYNPDGKPPEVPPLLAPEPYMRDLLEALSKAEEQIAASGWAPSNSNQGPQEYGKELHRRVWSNLDGAQGWYSSVWFNTETRELLSIGTRPPGTFGDGVLMEADLVYVEYDLRATIGQPFDTGKFFRVADIKATIEGTMKTKQLAKYRKVFGANADIFIVLPMKIWKVGIGLVEGPARQKFGSFLRKLGYAAPAVALVGFVSVAKGDLLETKFVPAVSALENTRCMTQRIGRYQDVADVLYEILGGIADMTDFGTWFKKIISETLSLSEQG